jgi:hypothetical protein
MKREQAAVFFSVLVGCCAGSIDVRAEPSRVEVAPEGVVSINGRKVFSIGLTLPPAPDAKTPSGKGALQEFHDAGVTFIRTGPTWDYVKDRPLEWNDEWFKRERAYMDAAAKAGVWVMPTLKELSTVKPGDTEQEAKLRAVIRRFRDHPGLGVWKGSDEPQWGKKSVESVVRAYQIIKEEDRDHPVWIVQAPRGSVAELRPYTAGYDIGGVDVYPIGYPPGTHLEGPNENREISMIGDYARKQRQVEQGRRPFWFTLQIAWSGVEGPAKTLRFPTFPQERFMTYEAIINGARGLVYFGGSLPSTLSEKDRSYGWNWTFWERVLRPVFEEVGAKSPLAAALCAPESKLAVKAQGNDVELCVREVGREVFVLACCRDPRKTAKVTFSGLPRELGEGDVMYESPRKVKAAGGEFTDWFGPFEVHVYRFRRQ